MSHRRPHPRLPSGPVTGPEVRPRGALLRKYQELTAKHEALVHRLEHRNDERISTYQLSTWALETTASALVLLRAQSVLLANRRWHALARSGPWQPLRQGETTGPLMATLREVVNHEIEALLSSKEKGIRDQLYRKQGSNETLEIRVERAGPLTRVAHTQMVLALIHDVTQETLAAAELEEAREALARQENLRALGEMASGIAHDLNNTLNAMRLRLELLQRDAEFAPHQAKNLKSLTQIVSDAGTRVRHLQEFSRQRFEPSHEQVHLHGILREAVELARDSIEQRAQSEGIQVRIVNEVPVLPAVNGEAADLRYVFLNLILNARDAMPQGGTVYLRGTASATRVVITVEDEGTGIPKDHLDSIFMPFFTTKGAKGTGLGLSMAYGVVSRSGGAITAANRPKGGAVFTLTFPVQNTALAAPEPHVRTASSLRTLRGRVLVIDDEASSRETLMIALESLGLTVEGVASGTAALKLLRKGLLWDAVLCNHGMPALKGETVAQRLNKLAPQLPLFLLTSSPIEDAAQAAMPSNVRGLLAKPLALAHLWEVLDRVLPRKK
ncbi:ATP-binding protein [Stigmatella sp. ncwal1]|uniref:histidine kinase n=1 Tax=Stigmatella ashevillensis TaxID=2995309 RepID=A0ABT5DB87_9BACT|nr:ATP-binding protein [Stigmatella ashevillena]MDC0710922.1 ATP-binding protein [Stigmatella ashevillena]